MIDDIVQPIPVDEHELAARALRFANEILNGCSIWQRRALVAYGGDATLSAIIPKRSIYHFHMIADQHADYVAYREALGCPGAQEAFDQMIGRNIFQLIEQRVLGRK